MKTIRICTIMFALALLASCGGGAKDPKEKKQKELDAKRKELATLQSEIQKLEKELGDSSSKDNRALVELDTLVSEPFRHYVEIQGKVDAEENIAVSAKSPGVVTAIYVNEGDQVKKGQVLAQLDNQATVQGLEEVKSQLAFAENIYQKQKALWDKKIGSEVQYLNAKNNRDALVKKVETLNEQVELGKIKSPINGTVDEVMVKVGQFANPGPQTPAFRVVNFSKLKVRAEAPESYTGKVKKGNKVVIEFPDLKKELEGKLDFVAGVINPQTRTFFVEAPLESKSEYRPNMIAILKIVDYEGANTITVPVNAIQRLAGATYVMVARQEAGKMIARRAEIETGLTYNNRTEIKSGLKDGDVIIVTGAGEVNDGDPVKVK
ncbi:MAG: efflux RND transporter periplasmic adaptor subunit [Chitinophagales bacterium]|nr:efflux RND transporter periplasmic adaptor subunit [Chitinophagales bacterium]